MTTRLVHGARRWANSVWRISVSMATGTGVAMLFLGSATAQQTSSAKSGRPAKPVAAPFTTEVERCIVPASMHHSVNYHVLRAILRVESGLNPKAVGRNTNGTIDVGMGQYNSMHFRELAKFGIAPEHLLDACVSTYVTAWHLKKNIVARGNTWAGIAAYHSATPYFNHRYQILVKNEMIRSGAMAGQIQSVPPLVRRSSGDSVASASNVQSQSTTSMIVTDAP